MGEMLENARLKCLLSQVRLTHIRKDISEVMRDLVFWSLYTKASENAAFQAALARGTLELIDPTANGLVISATCTSFR